MDILQEGGKRPECIQMLHVYCNKIRQSYQQKLRAECRMIPLKSLAQTPGDVKSSQDSASKGALSFDLLVALLKVGQELLHFCCKFLLVQESFVIIEVCQAPGQDGATLPANKQHCGSMSAVLSIDCPFSGNCCSPVALDQSCKERAWEHAATDC